MPGAPASPAKLAVLDELLAEWHGEEDALLASIQEKYLPALADGTYIPCFGLTGVHSGSDATSLIGSFGEVEERDGELQELVDLPSLKPIWPTDVESSESITATKGDKSIKLSPLASNIYQANFTQLKAVCKLLSKQSEVGRRIKQPLSEIGRASCRERV